MCHEGSLNCNHIFFGIQFKFNLKKWFCRFQFSIAKYDCPDRQELIKNADLIVYVCATEQEINDIEKKLLKIGQNSYHDEFNKIHFLDPNSSKCIDIALFSDISEISKKNKNKKKKAKQKFKASSIPLIEINSFRHTKKIFRLPQESKDFLIEIQSKLENKKMCNFEKKCSESIIKQTQKCIFSLILNIVNSKYRKILTEIDYQIKFEEVNYDYFN